MAPDRVHYLTKDGLGRLREELKKLRTERTRLIQELEDGDEGRDELDIIEKRIDEMEQTQRSSELIAFPPKHKRDTVALGARVSVRVDGRDREFVIVGTLEVDPLQGKISNESPVGALLMGKKIGDRVVVRGSKEITYIIKDVMYGIKKV